LLLFKLLLLLLLLSLLLLLLLLLNRLESGPCAVRKPTVLSRPLVGGGVGLKRSNLLRSVIIDAVIRWTFANVVPESFCYVPVWRHGGRRGGHRTAANPPFERRLYPTKTVAPVAL